MYLCISHSRIIYIKAISRRGVGVHERARACTPARPPHANFPLPLYSLYTLMYIIKLLIMTSSIQADLNANLVRTLAGSPDFYQLHRRYLIHSTVLATRTKFIYK